MQPTELLNLLQQAGRDPSRLIFEDELTGIHNRRFLHSYMEHKVHWTSGADFPFSLLTLDLDHFKAVNDTHGHAAGDQLLTWVASVLREVAGDTAMPVRFGGDEFMMLLPKTDREGAQEMANRVLQRVRERPFRLREVGGTVGVTLSIGTATAPADATTGRELMHAADTALYHAKQSGRNQAATAVDVDPKKVFPRTALHRLLSSGIVGRDAELRAVSEALVALGGGRSQFLIFDGAAGMGKSTLLATIERNITGAEGFAVARVGCDQQEAFRPYYLATRILIALLNQREDKGAPVVQSLSSEEVAHLARIVPQVAEAAPPAPDADESTRRERTFTTLARFVPLVVDGRPLVLIIDDLQFADEATLLLLRSLLQSQKLPVLVCGAALEAVSRAPEPETPPIERFCSAQAEELGIRRLKLGALNEEHITDYLRSVFPNLRLRDAFGADLARITQGNPLFLGEIIRKLVADRKVTLVGREWVIEPLEEGYLPQSLADIVKEKIAALDAETRGLLEQASTFGEGVPVSMLAGSADVDENRVLEFLDRAEALGLVSLDFERNEEVMRFLGKQVLDISYGAIDETRRQALHEHVATYQEALYQQRRLPSASLLAYHFKRAANEEKARRYEQVQRGYAQMVFDPAEAARYKIEEVEEEAEGEGRLAPESIALVPNVLRAFMTAVRSHQLYPPESKAIPQALEQLCAALEELFTRNAWLHLSQDRQVLLANGQRLELTEWSALAGSFLELLDRFELQGLMFERGISEAELSALLMTLVDTKPAAIAPGFWKRTVAERGLSHVHPHQVRYAKTVRVRAARLIDQEEELKSEELAVIPRILRALQTAAKKVKLYPPEAEVVTQAVEQLHVALQDALRRRQSLTLASVQNALLANGVRVDTSGYETIASAIIDLLTDAGLQSVTVYADVQATEAAAFLGALRDLPASGTDTRFWVDFVRREGLTGLAFNQRHYAVSVVQGLLRETAAGDAAPEADMDAAAVEQLSEEPLEALRQALPRFGKELLVKGEHALVRKLLRGVFEGFQDQDPAGRVRTVQACHALFHRLIFGLRHKYAELAAGFLVAAVAAEAESQVLGELSELLHAMAGNAVLLGDHRLAARILLEVRTRQRQMAELGREGKNIAAALNGRLDAAALRLLDEDMRSGEPDRLERAAQVLGVLGVTAVPVLVAVIKQESNFHVRQLAAKLVAEAGPVGAEQIKRALATEVLVDPRTRLLEVVDAVTHDLRDELQHCLLDESPKIRRAAFQLFERLRQDDLIDVILPLARHSDPWVVRAAIHALTAFHTPAGVHALAVILQGTKQASDAVLCCQALGQSDDAAAIDPLARVLRARKFLVFGRRWGSEVRATAALALKQIPHPRAAEVLARYARDRDAWVRRLSQEVTEP